jgi:hypothetical protein
MDDRDVLAISVSDVTKPCNEYPALHMKERRLDVVQCRPERLSAMNILHSI